MSDSLVQCECDDALAVITLNRPAKRNALNRQLLEGLLECVTDIAERDDVRIVVLRANGPVFCAGMDLAEMQSRIGRDDAEQLWQADTEIYRDVLRALFELPVPTLAVVQGVAVAGGLGLVLACDLVLAAESAFFALPEPQRGITAAVVTPYLLYRVGVSPATDLLLSGRTIDTAHALRIGLAHETVAPDELDVRAQNWIQNILRGGPSALATTKRFLRELTVSSLSEQLDAGMQISAEARATDEACEGLAAFLEKRPPNW